MSGLRVSARTRRALGTVGIAVATWACAAPATLRAQTFDGSAGGYALQRRLGYRGGIYDQHGTVYGGSGSVQLWRLRLGASGWAGSLTADGGVPNADAKVRTTALTLHAAVTSVLLIGYRLETRRFESDAGVTVWQLRGWDLLLEPDLGISGLRGLADIALLSSSVVRDGPGFDKALQTTMGVTYTPPRSRLRLRLAYRFERYDEQSTAPVPPRLEQFRGLIVEAGFRVGR